VPTARAVHPENHARPHRRAPRATRGVRVLDLTRLLPGPLATQHLADYGADVIKVEDTGAGDYARTMGAMGGDTSWFYQVVNRNKRSLRLDLKQAEGRALFLRLVETADVVVEGFRPGVMERLGLGYEALAERNPRVVLCSISGYGQTGPYALARRPRHQLPRLRRRARPDRHRRRRARAVQPADRRPARRHHGRGDGHHGRLVRCAAQRPGAQVDVSMTDASFAHMIFPLTEVLANGRVRPRGEDLLSGGVPCYGVYETADGRHMAVGALEEKFWHLLCDTLGRADLKPGHLADRAEGARVRAELAAIFRSRSQRDWVAIFDAVDCCVTPVLRLEESLEDAQLQARGMVVEVGGVRQFGPAVRMTAMPSAAARARAGRRRGVPTPMRSSPARGWTRRRSSGCARRA
jgi:alpha-methylacyl-CoA racemase